MGPRFSPGGVSFSNVATREKGTMTGHLRPRGLVENKERKVAKEKPPEAFAAEEAAEKAKEAQKEVAREQFMRTRERGEGDGKK